MALATPANVGAGGLPPIRRGHRFGFVAAAKQHGLRPGSSPGLPNLMHEHIARALRLWQQLIVVTPDAKSYKIRDWGLVSSYEELNEAQELDGTGISTVMLLESLFRGYSERHVTLSEILAADKSYLRQLATARRLRQALNHPEIRQVVDEFHADQLKALAHYGAYAATLKEAQDPMFLGLLRLSAFKAMTELQEHQFLYGKPTTPTGKYNWDVYQFMNVNSLLEASVQHMEPGITLALIRTDEADRSYFVFSVWTGAALTILTDKRQVHHPLQESMSRRPDRELAKRWDRFYFPYYLLGAKWHTKFVEIPNQTGMIRYKYSATPLADVASLEPECVVWLLQMFSFLNDKYFKNAHRVALCSYMGESVAPNVPVASSIILRDGWTPLLLPTVTREDVKTEGERSSTGFNQWLENKFSDQVPESFLNLAVTDRQKLLPPADVGPKSKEMKLFRALKKDLLALPPTDFGTAEKLKADHQWFSRYNLAVAVKYLTKKDFEKRENEVLKWYRDKVRENRETLISAAAIGLLLVDRIHWYGFCEGPHNSVGDEPTDTKMHTSFFMNLLNLEFETKGYRKRLYKGLWLDLETGDPWNCKAKCVITGTRTSIQATLEPGSPQEIAAVCNCEVSELLPELQNYYQSEPYDRNSILDRIDPMDWVIKNPWLELKLGIGICLSRRGINRRRKELGLLPIWDWGNASEINLDAAQGLLRRSVSNLTTGKTTTYLVPAPKPKTAKTADVED